MQETQLNGESLDIVSENVSKLKELFPEIVTEDKIDFDKLKAVLGEYTEDDSERYNFTWKGKSKALRLAQTPSNGTLRPCKEESKNWDTTENLYIEGDNLEVLKLLQKSYYGKIKMIYIDPPYNTGKEFVYQDDYMDNLKNYLQITGQVGAKGTRISTNTDTSGRYHTNWLNMMYPRLRLARNLLTDDGVIFISIDDSEFSNLKKLCDEIFGEENFIATICQKSRGGISNDKIISENHNYHLFYAKNKSVIHNNRKNYGVKKTEEDFKRFNKNDNDGNGPYSLNPVSGPGGARKGNPYYEFMGVNGYFRFSKERMEKMYNEGKVVKINDNLYQKTYLNDLKDNVKKISTWWDNVGTTSKGTNLIKKLFPELDVAIFDHPKPVELIKLMLEYCNVKENDIILDFFAGSATTAHAIWELNKEDEASRKFILVQLPEPTAENTDAYKAGYLNICEISKERLRRAGDYISGNTLDQKQTLLDSNNPKIDIGFKVFKLDSSNFVKWNPEYDNLEQTLLDSVENLVPGRSELDLVYEIMLKYGIDLNLPIEEYQIQEKKFYSIGFGALIICLDDNLTSDLASEIIKLKNKLSPEVMRVVFKDNGFASDSDKTNIKETLKTNGIEEFVTI
ncbi:MAG: site-specific DNA-methyltransferase [Methanobacteriaceae archaeon]